MIQLKLDLVADLNLGEGVLGITSLEKLIPAGAGRAWAFGWGTIQDGKRQHWIAEIDNGAVSHKILPYEMTHCQGLLSEQSKAHAVVAFKLGAQLGVLLGSEAILLFAKITDEPIVIRIENHFGPMGEPRHETHLEDSYYQPTHCGNASEGLVPVVLRHPLENGDRGRYIGLLEINQSTKSARWLNTLPDGAPRTTRLEDYLQFPLSEIHGGLRLVKENGKSIFRHDLPPVITDCSWFDGQWHLYAGGYSGVPIRYGLPLGVLTRHDAELKMTDLVVRPTEQCFGQICASLDRVIITPLRKNGLRKGKQSIYLLQDDIDYPVKLPKGFTKYHIQEYFEGQYWLTPNAAGYNGLPTQVVACSASGGD